MEELKCTLTPEFREPDPYGWLEGNPDYQLPPEWVAAIPVPELHSLRIVNSFDEEGQARAGAYILPVLNDPDHGLLPLAMREFIGVVVSAANSCVTCLIIHGHKLGELIGDHNRARRIAINYRTVKLSAQERAIADFAIKLTELPGRSEPGDLQALRDAGLTDAQIYFIVEVVATFNFTNRITSGYGMRPDDEFMAQISPVLPR